MWNKSQHGYRYGGGSLLVVCSNQTTACALESESGGKVRGKVTLKYLLHKSLIAKLNLIFKA